MGPIEGRGHGKEDPLVIGHGAFGEVKIVDTEAESRLLKRD